MFACLVRVCVSESNLSTVQVSGTQAAEFKPREGNVLNLATDLGKRRV